MMANHVISRLLAVTDLQRSVSSSQTTTRRNECVHSAKVVPWQMFLATYAGMSMKKNFLTLRIDIYPP
jgi:hypothetical protein